MDLWSAVILGLVQALTEFIPVSSSAHLVLAEHLLGFNPPGGIAFEMAVHLGTLVSVMILFRKDLMELCGAALGALRHPSRLRAWREAGPLRDGLLITLGCVPAGLVGLFFQDALEATFDSPLQTCVELSITGVVLLATKLVTPVGQPITVGRALIIGVAQALSILPGISRSGATIAAALFLGVKHAEAGRYSFLMSVPLIGGACVLKGRDVLASPLPTDALLAMGVGAIVAFLGGLWSLWMLIRILRGRRFADFGWYCLAVGGLGIALLWR